jgi:hypothetical protein
LTAAKHIDSCCVSAPGLAPTFYNLFLVTP